MGYFVGESSTYSHKLFESGYIHKVKVTGLTPRQLYYYVCGNISSGPFSSENSFYAAPEVSLDSKLKFAVWGDPGQTQNSLYAGLEVVKQQPDMIFIPGDVSYADQDESRWDSWGRMFEFATARYPTMVIPGNHENVHQFIGYQSRFFMPSEESKAKEKNLYWSVNVGPVHLVTLNTESDYDYSTDMYNWFIADLKNVDRKATPWLVLSFHRPYYNSNKAHFGQMKDFQAIYEPLLDQFCVDYVLTGHVHACTFSYLVF